MPIKLFKNWYLCKDTTIPNDYPPKAKEMIVGYRLEIMKLHEEKYRVK